MGWYEDVNTGGSSTHLCTFPVISKVNCKPLLGKICFGIPTLEATDMKASATSIEEMFLKVQSLEDE